MKQEVKEVKEEPQETSLSSLFSLPSTPWPPSTPTPVVVTLPKRPRAASEISAPPRSRKQPIRKERTNQVNSNVRTRTQKEQENEPLLKGLDK